MIFLIQIIIGAVSALLLSGIGYLIFKDPKRKLFQVLVVGGTALTVSVCNKTVIPILEEWKLKRELRAELMKIELYSEIKKANEETYFEIEKRVLDVAKNGTNVSEAMVQAQQLIMGSFSKFLPISTNGAVRTYMVANINAASELCATDIEYCYEYIYGAAASQPGVTRRLSKEAQSVLMNAVGKVIVEAKKNPQPKIDSVVCQSGMEKAFKEAYEIYGEDIFLVTEPAKPGIDRKRLMDATGNIYRTIFKYPENEGGEILRCMLSGI